MTKLSVAEARELGRKAQGAIVDALVACGGEASRETLIDAAQHSGVFSARELAAPAPVRQDGALGRTPVRFRLDWALTELRRAGIVENVRWGVWRLVTDGAVDGGRASELASMPYAEYLHSPEWQRVRASAMWSAQGRCALDVEHTEHLEVHHRTYERRGSERPEDLVVLCRDCHAMFHRTHGRPGHAGTPALAAA